MKVRSGNFYSGLIGRFICLCLLISCLGPCGQGSTRADAQAFATLSGTIQDQSGAVVPDVRVTVMNSGIGIERQVTTDGNGYFVIAMLEAGEYVLTVEMPGFRMLTEDLILESGANRILTITLRPRDLSESITVQATGKSADIHSNHIDIGSATLKYSMTGKQVAALPVWSTALGRNGLAVLPFLVPGVSPTSATGSADALVNRLGSQMSVNGSRPSTINFNLEGGDNNDLEYNRASSPLPNPDVLQEFIVSTNNYGAEQGRNSGGILDAVIKSGGARYSGNARYYLMNEALNARGFFDSRVPIERLNTFGAQLGGPLVVPRLFRLTEKPLFFVDYERTGYTQERTSPPISLWTEAERKGDFSRSVGIVRPRDPLTSKPFPGDIIPASRIDPLARLYMDRFFPLPNEADRLFRQLLLDRTLTDQLTSRVDVKMTRSDNLSAVLIRTASVVSNGSPILPVGSREYFDSTNTNLTVRETHTFSPRAISQLTLTLARYDYSRNFSFPGASGILPEVIGFTGVHPQPSRFPALPAVSIFGIGSIADGSASETAKMTWQIKEDVSLAKLNGVLKFGGETRGFRQELLTESDNGRFTFSSPYTLNLLSDFLLGKPVGYTQASGSSIYPRQRSYYLYAADDWRVKPNLTLNLGLRYEIAPPLTDKLDQVTAFRPGESSQRFPDAPNGLLFAGDPDPVLGRVPRGVYPADMNNFAPRIGVAYSPKPKSGLLRFVFGDGKSAIRAGGGIFYDQTAGNSFTRFSFVQPFAVQQALGYEQFKNKGGTFANPFGALVNPWPIDLSERAFAGKPDITRTFDPTFRTAQTYQYNLTVQRELGWSFLMELAYVGSTSLKLNRARDLNIAAASDIAEQGPPRHRPYSSLGGVVSRESSGRARYDSVQLRFARRPAKGLMLDCSYVLGKSLDNGSSPDQLAGPDQFRWARSSFDRRHNIVVSYGYELPPTPMKGLLGGVLNGWQLGGITEFRSGMPIDIVQFPLGTGISGLIPYRIPDLVRPFKKLNPRERQTLVVNGNKLTGNFFFDPGAFRETDVDYTQPGTLGRNVFSGPGINLWSLSIIKRIRITESQHFSLRSDIRNIFNRAHFENPTAPLPNSTFGQVPGAGPGRNVQLSLKYTF